MEIKELVKNTKPYVCTTCGCLVAHLRAHEVTKDDGSGAWGHSSYYYCSSCAPAYGRITYNWKKGGSTLSGPVIQYFIRIPEHYEEVTEEGKPLKKKK